jgi:putative inorganic carbon (HCO3(-)) transporter
MQNKTTTNIFHWLYLAGFFMILALPLFAAPPWLHPAAWGKTILFRIISTSMIFLFLCEVLLTKNQKRLSTLYHLKKKSKIAFWLLIALLGVVLLSAIFSLDPYFSFWGSPYRAGGAVTFSFYIIFALLAFLILRKKDWQRIWNFSLVVGILVSIIALLQYFHILSQVLIPYEDIPPSTLGNATFLAIYLSFLSFLALSFVLKTKEVKKKVFYFIAILLFLFVILITEARAVYLGLLIGFLYFFLFYPKKIYWLKAAIVILLLLMVAVIYYVNTTSQLPDFIESNRILKAMTERLSIELLLKEARFPAWKLSLNAIQERPILGWGPENFSIAIDKYYDSGILILTGQWWDRAHNFLLDIGITIGIPGLLIYLALFAILLWQLRKLKYANLQEYGHESTRMIAHGIQASFLAYLTANLFSFDTFSTYLISFLLISYSLYLISNTQNQTETEQKSNNFQRSDLWKLSKFKMIVIFALFISLAWFIWYFNIKPLQINKEVNWADFYSQNKQCEKATERIEKVLSSHSIIDHYARLKYLDIIKECIEAKLGDRQALNYKAISVLKEAIKTRPKYTRSWIFLGLYTNSLVEHSEEFKIENVEGLTKEASSYFEEANKLSPKRGEVFLGWVQTDLLSGEYQKAKQRVEQCIDLNPTWPYCWWQKALTHIYLDEIEEAEKSIEAAIQKGYNTHSEKSLNQLIKAYMKLIEANPKRIYYEKLVDVYEELRMLVPQSIQYRASWAYVHRELGEYDKAREIAIGLVEIAPETIYDVEEFLKSIVYLDNDYARHHYTLARMYYILKDYKRAGEETLTAQSFAIPGSELKIEIDSFLRYLPTY